MSRSSEEREERLVESGNWGDVLYAVRSNGTMPAKDFIDGLGVADARKLSVLFRRMAEFGLIHNTQQFKMIEGKIWEFKRGQIRIGCFRVGNTWFLTHGFIKKRDKWPAREKERAKTIRKEHLAGRG